MGGNLRGFLHSFAVSPVHALWRHDDGEVSISMRPSEYGPHLSPVSGEFATDFRGIEKADRDRCFKWAWRPACVWELSNRRTQVSVEFKDRTKLYWQRTKGQEARKMGDASVEIDFRREPE